MVRRTLVGIGMVLALGAPLFAQEHESAAQERPRPSQQEEERARAREKERAKELEAQGRERVQEQEAKERARAQEQEKEKRERQEAAGGQPVNIRLELTIRDQRGSAQPTTKTVSLVTADRSVGRIRTSGTVRTEKFGLQNVVLNIDARPVLIGRDGNVRVSLTVEYRPADTESSYTPGLSETIECVLTPGQTLVASRSADPDTDRSVTVEIKAMLLK